MQRDLLRQHIRSIDTEIQEMKDEDKISKYQQYVHISQDVEATEQAHKLVVKMMHDKKVLHKRKQ